MVLEKIPKLPWTARSNRSILKEINPGCSLEGLMLKLKLQYSGYLMKRVNSLVKTLMLGKIEGRRRRVWQRMRWLDGITNSIHEFQQTAEMVKDREAWKWYSPWGCKDWTRLRKWTTMGSHSIYTTTWPYANYFCCFISSVFLKET